MTLPGVDKEVERLCQVLTNNGYVTFGSCEGHGRKKPYITFWCKKPSAVAELSYVLRQTAIANFIWVIGIYDVNDGRRFKPYYEITPERSRRINLDTVKDESYLIEDFDILGYSIMEHFLNKKNR